MLSRAALTFSPQCGQVRNMATLKEINNRLKAVTNIQKITKSMKMVSAAKYARAERELKPAKAYGRGAQAFYERAEIKQEEDAPNHLIIAMTSDRGLCGGVHSAISKKIRDAMPDKPAAANVKIVCVGDKSRAMLGRLFPKMMLMHFTEIGKQPPTFGDASLVAQEIFNSDYKFNHGEMHYNVFQTVMQYHTVSIPVFTTESVQATDKMSVYDSIDDEVIQSYNEYSLASYLYYAMKEGACTEQSQRMSAMEAATQNAGEMINTLQLTYNRKRQAVITTELVEIISGAAALE